MKALALAACCLSAVLSVARGDYTWSHSEAFGGPDIGVYRLDLYRQNGPADIDAARRKRNVLVSWGKHIFRLIFHCIRAQSVMYCKPCLNTSFLMLKLLHYLGITLRISRGVACLLCWDALPRDCAPYSRI